MCTVTVLRAGEMLRVACNRDEQRRRPTAHPPLIVRAGRGQVLTPLDPQGGGTWIAANSEGLTFALLNVNRFGHGAATGRRSRGSIIPGLWDCARVDEVASRLEQVMADDFAPCRLLVADASEAIEFASAGARWHAQAHRLDRPLLFTSSSLGDVLVEGPRRVLFEQMLSTPWDVAAQQDAFHAHRWRDRPAISVHMSRPDSCTVSTTTIEVASRDVRMRYESAHGLEGIPVGLVIDRQHVEPQSAPWSRREYAAV